MAHGRHRELRPVVRANVLGRPARNAELGETAEHVLRVQPPCNVDRQALPRVRVYSSTIASIRTGRPSALRSKAKSYDPTWFGRSARQFQRYVHKYGKTHEDMAPVMSNSRRNGLHFPERYWAQHRPEELTTDDYVNARWVAKPANLFDFDIPIMASAADLFTTAERAQDMAQKPVHILHHASPPRTVQRSLIPTLEECEEDTAMTAQRGTCRRIRNA